MDTTRDTTRDSADMTRYVLADAMTEAERVRHAVTLRVGVLDAGASEAPYLGATRAEWAHRIAGMFADGSREVTAVRDALEALRADIIAAPMESPERAEADAYHVRATSAHGRAVQHRAAVLAGAMRVWDIETARTAARWARRSEDSLLALRTQCASASASIRDGSRALNGYGVARSVQHDADARGRIVRNAAILISEAMASAWALAPDASEAEVERARADGLARAYARMDASTDASADAGRARSASEAGGHSIGGTYGIPGTHQNPNSEAGTADAPPASAPLLKPRSDAPRIVVPDTIYSVASYPTKLESWCATRRAYVPTASYSLPAGTSCPGAVYAARSASEADAVSMLAHASEHDAHDAEASAVCADCYAARLIRLRRNVRDAHGARWADVTDAARAYGRHGMRAMTRGRTEATYLDAVTEYWRAGGAPAQNVPDAVMVRVRHAAGADAVAFAERWTAWTWRVDSAMRVALSRALECPCCRAFLRIRWHMSGDIFSPAYAALIRLVWAPLLDSFQTLHIWAPTRNWHDGTPTRVRDATTALASFHARANLVASALYVGGVVTAEAPAVYVSRTMVGASVDAITAAGYDACHAQTRSAAHNCAECVRCYVTGTRVGYVKH